MTPSVCDISWRYIITGLDRRRPVNNVTVERRRAVHPAYPAVTDRHSRCSSPAIFNASSVFAMSDKAQGQCWECFSTSQCAVTVSCTWRRRAAAIYTESVAVASPGGARRASRCAFTNQAEITEIYTQI